MTARKKQCMLLLALGLAACSDKDWRQRAIDNAEDRVRSEVGDPAAQFSKLGVTGNSSSGQTCGIVIAKTAGGFEQFARFIAYIDGAGPYLDKGLGAHPITQSKFDFAWENDCLKEGYNG